MPTHAPTRCSDPQCGQYATYEGRCEQHRRKPWANKSRRNQVLDPTTWATTAAAHLTVETTCRACGIDTGLQVDHITEIADGGALYDEQNLQTLCGTCHIKKTRTARALRKQRRAEEH